VNRNAELKALRVRDTGRGYSGNHAGGDDQDDHYTDLY